MTDPFTNVTVGDNSVVIETTISQALLIARGLRHFAGAGAPNWELSVAELAQCSNVVVSIEETME